MKRHKKRTLHVTVIIILMLLVSYAFATGSIDTIKNLFPWFSEEETVKPPDLPDGTDPDPQPEPEPEPQPKPEPDPQPQPEPEPEPQPEPKPDPGGDATDTPIIYVGQQLIIPVSGSVTTSSSQVVKQGIIPGDNKQIALTFDAGWLFDQTTSLLDVLDNYGVKSTFFTRALWVEAHPDLAREIVSRGHIIENHSLTHGHMTQMTDAQIRNELQKSTQIIKTVTKNNPYLFRPPFGEYDNRMLKILAEEGYPYTVMWTVDTHDWAEEISGQKVTADYLVNRVLKNSSNNGIILMHVGGYKTVEALPRIITGLREQGYQLVTVNHMMPPPSQGVLTHTVVKGETLYALSQRYGVTIQQIIMANGL